MLQRIPSQSGPGRGSFASRTAAILVAALTFFSAGLWAAPSGAAQPRVAASAVHQMDVLRSIKTSKSAVQNKIDSRLFLGLLHQRNDARLAPLTELPLREAGGRRPGPGRHHSLQRRRRKAAVNQVEALGGVVKAMSYAYRRVSARVHIGDLETLAGDPAGAQESGRRSRG